MEQVITSLFDLFDAEGLMMLGFYPIYSQTDSEKVLGYSSYLIWDDPDTIPFGAHVMTLCEIIDDPRASTLMFNAIAIRDQQSRATY